MFTKILVGVDGSQGGRDALALGSAIAGVTGAELVAVHVYPTAAMPGLLALGFSGESLRAAAEELLGQQAATLPPGGRALAVPGRSAARALQQVADAEHADLLVVGSSSLGRVGRVLLGDHARQAVHQVSCAVAVAPRGFADAPSGLATIAVGFDGGPDAQRALDEAAALALAAGARLRIVAALTPPFDGAAAYAYPYPVDWSAYYDHLRKRRRGELDDAVAALDVPATSEMTQGWPPTVLEEVSGEVDLLVVGSRHWGAVNRLLMGSTSTALVGRAHCPMMVVPRSDGAGDATEAVAAVAEA